MPIRKLWACYTKKIWLRWHTKVGNKLFAPRAVCSVKSPARPSRSNVGARCWRVHSRVCGTGMPKPTRSISRPLGKPCWAMPKTKLATDWMSGIHAFIRMIGLPFMLTLSVISPARRRFTRIRTGCGAKMGITSGFSIAARYSAPMQTGGHCEWWAPIPMSPMTMSRSDN